MNRDKANSLAAELAEKRQNPYGGGNYQPSVVYEWEAFKVALPVHRMEQERILDLMATATRHGAQMTVSEYGVTFA